MQNKNELTIENWKKALLSIRSKYQILYRHLNDVEMDVFHIEYKAGKKYAHEMLNNSKIEKRGRIKTHIAVGKHECFPTVQS